MTKRDAAASSKSVSFSPKSGLVVASIRDWVQKRLADGDFDTTETLVIAIQNADGSVSTMYLGKYLTCAGLTSIIAHDIATAWEELPHTVTE